MDRSVARPTGLASTRTIGTRSACLEIPRRRLRHHPLRATHQPPSRQLRLLSRHPRATHQHQHQCRGSAHVPEAHLGTAILGSLPRARISAARTSGDLAHSFQQAVDPLEAGAGVALGHVHPGSTASLRKRGGRSQSPQPKRAGKSLIEPSHTLSSATARLTANAWAMGLSACLSLSRRTVLRTLAHT